LRTNRQLPQKNSYEKQASQYFLPRTHGANVEQTIATLCQIIATVLPFQLMGGD
jgi:hypothetical protein